MNEDGYRKSTGIARSYKEVGNVLTGRMDAGKVRHGACYACQHSQFETVGYEEGAATEFAKLMYVR